MAKSRWYLPRGNRWPRIQPHGQYLESLSGLCQFPGLPRNLLLCDGNHPRIWRAWFFSRLLISNCRSSWCGKSKNRRNHDRTISVRQNHPPVLPHRKEKVRYQRSQRRPSLDGLCRRSMDSRNRWPLHLKWRCSLLWWGKRNGPWALRSFHFPHPLHHGERRYPLNARKRLERLSQYDLPKRPRRNRHGRRAICFGLLHDG